VIACDAAFHVRWNASGPPAREYPVDEIGEARDELVEALVVSDRLPHFSVLVTLSAWPLP